MDSILGIKRTDIATVKYNRLVEWDKELAHSVGIVNMLDVFMESWNKAHNDLYAAIKPYEDSLPPEVKLLLVDQDRQVEDQISRAKAIQDLTENITWMWTDVNLTRRDNALLDSKEKLVGNTKKLLHGQKLHGPSLFYDRIGEVQNEEVQRLSSSVVVATVRKLGQSFKQGQGQKSRGLSYWKKDQDDDFHKERKGQGFQRNQGSKDDHDGKSRDAKKDMGSFWKTRKCGGY